MLEDHKFLYDAFKSKDSRFDGHFFVGVSSTGIYCRPICRARLPKAENCTFYMTAAEAEQSGYRPCLICRPELAPGYSITDAKSILAGRAIRHLEENCGSGKNLDELSGELGCTSRHLRRVFSEEFNVSPVQYMLTCRLLLAKNILTNSNISVIDAAFASGFGSLRRFNDAFKKHYNLSPSELRKRTGKNKNEAEPEGHTVMVSLGYRPPYLWEDMLEFLKGRCIPGVDMVKDDQYLRTVHFITGENKEFSGWISVGNEASKNILKLSVSEALLPVLPQIIVRVKQMFDLSCDPHIIYDALYTLNDLKPGICRPGTRLPGCFNSFEMSVRAILGQQISVKAASTIAGRLVSTFGIPVETDIEGLTHIFPTPESIIALSADIYRALGPLGITRMRAETILALAKAISEKRICLEACPAPEDEIRRLMSIRGIGSWTAQYIAMRTMSWPDAFLETDAGVRHALSSMTPREMLKISERWRPWRSYAVINLWNSLQC